MKKLLMLGAISAVTLSIANAEWYGDDYDRGYTPVRHDYEDRGHRGYRDDRRGYDHRRGMNLEARAQLRLRRLGYYHGPIDGSFGSGSRRALYRFQRDRYLPLTGYLDWRTRRALGI